LKKELGMMGGDKRTLSILEALTPHSEFSVIDTIKKKSLAEVEF